jgi:hypothetical protein
MSGRAERRRRERAERKRANQTGDITRTENPDGTSSIDASGAAAERLGASVEAQLAAFRARFGRDPEPDDPLFFDADAPGDEPRPLPVAGFEAAVVEAMVASGVSPAIVYAYQQTGMLVTEENWSLLSAEELAEWDAALARYRGTYG